MKQTLVKKTKPAPAAPSTAAACAVRDSTRQKSFASFLQKRSPFVLLLSTALSGCVIHHVQPYNPETAPAPETADAASSSTNCFEASTVAERMVCANPDLAPLNPQMT